MNGVAICKFGGPILEHIVYSHLLLNFFPVELYEKNRESPFKDENYEEQKI